MKLSIHNLILLTITFVGHQFVNGQIQLFDPVKEKRPIEITKAKGSGNDQIRDHLILDENMETAIYAESVTNLSNYLIEEYHEIALMYILDIEIVNNEDKLLLSFRKSGYIHYSETSYHCVECANKKYYYSNLIIPISLKKFPLYYMSCEEISSLTARVGLKLGFKTVYDPNYLGTMQPHRYSECSEQGIWPANCYHSLSGKDFAEFGLVCSESINGSIPSLRIGLNSTSKTQSLYTSNCTINALQNFTNEVNHECESQLIMSLDGHVIKIIDNPSDLFRNRHNLPSGIYIMKCGEYISKFMIP